MVENSDNFPIQLQIFKMVYIKNYLSVKNLTPLESVTISRKSDSVILKLRPTLFFFSTKRK